MEKTSFVAYLMFFIFVIGYFAVIFEHYIKVNKTASALIMAVLSWGVLFYGNRSVFVDSPIVDEQIGNISQIIFFLLGAVTLVELIDSHQGFKIITDVINTRSKKKMLWVVGFLAFFLSAILDNLTTTIVLISVLRKVVFSKEDRAYLGAIVVIAANAGGAWTPIGDVTTTMLWIKGHLTTHVVIKSLFIPSIFSLIVSSFFLSFNMKGKYPDIIKHKEKHQAEPGAKVVFIVGVLSLASVPFIKELTGLPPFMSILIGLGILWAITDAMHHKYEERIHLRVPHILTKIDASSILFFLGILLCISSLELVGILKNLALFLDKYVANPAIISTIIGLLSSVVDNVPLVAACTGMYSLQVYPQDASFWQMIAYAAGTGGSVLIIGSAAGVAFMSLEKIDFIWYLRKITPAAFTGYLAGMACYLLLQSL